MKRLAFAVLPACLLACTETPKPTAETSDAEHYLAQFIDTTVNPRDDFFHYSVGKWLKAHPIPASERAWGIYNVVQEETYNRLRGISEDAGKSNPAAGTNAQKIGDFWAALMDTATTAKLGFTPAAGTNAQKIGDFWAASMDTATTAKLGF